MSENNDPFAAFNSDRTVIKPSAGRGPRPVPGQAPAEPVRPPSFLSADGDPSAVMSIDAAASAGLNPLLAAAAPLLAAAPRLRTAPSHPDPQGLKQSLAEGIHTFEARARALGLPNEQVIAARYILCTLLDESAASTPWGSGSNWSSSSLLVQFHNESWGGEKIFLLMSKLVADVPTNRNLLELMAVVLGFGFEGRYRVVENGRAQLESLRVRLGQLLHQDHDKAMSGHWQGVQKQTTRLRDGIPLWVIAALVALVLAMVYMGLRLKLGADAASTFNSLAALDAKSARVAPPPPKAPTPRLAGFLTVEIEAGQVKVEDFANRSVVTLKGDGFFEPGSAEIAPQVRSVLPRIAQALTQTSGKLLITGHTDNQPIRTLRYPSNWHLSKDRAQAVLAELAKQVQSDRLRAEGRADSEPLADNASPAGRSANRRVEITLFVSEPGL
jgi:type VI secretion system protein ImpK